MANKTTVLIVEDDHLLSEVLCNQFRKDGFEPVPAYNGEEALEALSKSKPDLILLDLVMPKLSGFEFLAMIYVDPTYQNIPVVVLSNLGEPSDVQKARRFGVVAYFVKSSLSIDDVVKKVKETIENVPPKAS